MMPVPHSVLLLMADDDPDDRDLARQALQAARVRNRLDFVSDGEQLLDYLNRRGDFGHLAGDALPGLILLDLNMPRMDGREALIAIKADPLLRRIPVVVMTTSQSDEEVARAYDHGASSYIKKPVTFEGLVEVMRAIGRYWIDIVDLPPEPSSGD